MNRSSKKPAWNRNLITPCHPHYPPFHGSRIRHTAKPQRWSGARPHLAVWVSVLSPTKKSHWITRPKLGHFSLHTFTCILSYTYTLPKGGMLFLFVTNDSPYAFPPSHP